MITSLTPNINGYNGSAGPFEAKVNMDLLSLPNERAAYHSTPVTSHGIYSISLTSLKPCVSFKAPKTLTLLLSILTHRSWSKKPVEVIALSQLLQTWDVTRSLNLL